MSAETLYEHDFVTWTEQQAGALRQAARAGANVPLDWEHLAEEIEDLGSEVRTKVGSLTYRIQVHLLKIACSPAIAQHPDWMTEVDGFREQLERQLRNNHAVRAALAEVAAEEGPRAIRAAERTFTRFGETAALPLLRHWKMRGISAEEVQTDGLFPEPGTLTFRQEPD